MGRDVVLAQSTRALSLEKQVNQQRYGTMTQIVRHQMQPLQTRFELRFIAHVIKDVKFLTSQKFIVNLTRGVSHQFSGTCLCKRV